jgi:DNA-binding protein WhiA
MADKNSFSVQTKSELARIYPEKPCCRLAELAALVRMDGTVTIGANAMMGLYITTEYSAAARKVYRLLKDCFDIEGEITIKRQKRLKRHTLYNIRVPLSEDVPDILRQLGILAEGTGRGIEPGIKRSLIRTQCCRRCYLRGAFLGSGSVSNPDGNYHLEMIASDDRLAQQLAALVNRFPQIQAKVSQRKQWYIVYLKDSEQISAFLSVIGAHRALLEFENTKIMKDMKNQVNRLVNCETANLGKTVDAAMRQVENIELIDQTLGLENINEALAELAKLRLENQEMNLKELGELFNPPLGKSGVNHRMRKIEELAEQIRQRDEEQKII